MRTIVSVLCNGIMDTRFGLNRDRNYTHNLASHFDFAMLLSRNLATIPQLAASRLQVVSDSNFDSVFYIVIEDQSAMNTCSTANPNYCIIDRDLDTNDLASFYWDCALSGFSDSVEFDCDYADCDHEYCDTIDRFNITRSDMLLFPDDLEGIAILYIWKDSQGFTNLALVDNPNPMPVYALGL